jgi:hypothetical protein
MNHSRLIFTSNRPAHRQPPSSRRTSSQSSSNLALASEITPFEVELYQLAYITTLRPPGTQSVEPTLRAA